MQTRDEIIKNQARCISHEIRNQLSVCNIYCEIIKKHLEKNNIKISSIDNALNCIRKSSGMIGNTLLDLKALNNYEMKCYDLNLLLKQAIEMAKVYIIDKKIEILCESGSNVCVNVDENKFLACLLNIVKNAAEAIENEGFIHLKTELSQSFVYIRIINNGEKIPVDFVEKIFDKGQTSKTYGSGLGLFICKNNLNLMGGNLELVSSTDDITEFRIVLPLNKI